MLQESGPFGCRRSRETFDKLLEAGEIVLIVTEQKIKENKEYIFTKAEIQKLLKIPEEIEIFFFDGERLGIRTKWKETDEKQ